MSGSFKDLNGTAFYTTSPEWTVRLEAAAKYIRSIRNEKKKAFAVRYLLHVNGQLLTTPHRGDLSFMAGQAVEISINKIMLGEVMAEAMVR